MLIKPMGTRDMYHVNDSVRIGVNGIYALEYSRSQLIGGDEWLLCYIIVNTLNNVCEIYDYPSSQLFSCRAKSFTTFWKHLEKVHNI